MKKVKIFDSTFAPTSSSRAMMGGEFEVKTEYLDCNQIEIWNKDKNDTRTFNFSDVQEVTPAKFKGQSVCIGDEVEYGGKWREVYDCFIYCGQINLLTGNQNDSWTTKEESIEGLRPKYQPKVEEMTLEAVCKELGRTVKIVK